MDRTRTHTRDPHDRTRDSVVAQVASSGAAPSGSPSGTAFSRYSPRAILKIGWRRKWQIVLPAILIAGAASWWIQRLPDRYRAHALLLAVPQRVPEAFVRSTVTTRNSQALQSITQQILSRTQLEQVIRDFDLYPEDRKLDAMEDVVDAMRARDLEIQPVKGESFRLAFTAGNPDVAQRVVERLVTLLIVQTSADRTILAEGTDQFLEAQLADARRKLIDNELKLAQYRRQHNGELPTQVEANARGQNNAELQLQMLTESLNRDRERQLALERSIKDASLTELIDQRPREAPADPSKLTAAEQLERAEASLKVMRSTMTERHPDIVAMKQTIVELRERAEMMSARQVALGETNAEDRLRRSRLEELRAELSAVERQVAQKTAEGERLRAVFLNYQRRIEGTPAREAELAALTRDYDTLQDTYRGLLAKKQESEIAANLERRQIGAQFKVLDPARFPERPFAPKRARLYAMSVLGGLGVGVLLAVILELFDRGLRTQEEVRAALGLPVLATIPLVSARPRSIRRMVAVMSAVAAIGACVAAALAVAAR
jgi:polysaccharide chain length determinant protein (PEP-CTERM system associated)